MYIARAEVSPRRYEYILRQSRRSGGIVFSRDLAQLGPDPGVFIVYNGGVSFYVEEGLASRVREQDARISDEQLEEVFFPYLDPFIRSKLQPFHNRRSYRNWRRADDALRARALAETHPFDRSRLHFLRLGRGSMEDVDRSPALYTVLLDKSRDEIEQFILQSEQALPAREYPSYLFCSFHLQTHFRESYARSIPQALDREQLDAAFLAEFCALAEDTSFWSGFPRGQRLPWYLLRYAFLYFDHSAQEEPHWRRSQREREWAGSGRRGGGGAAQQASPGMTRQEALLIFGLSAAELGELNKKELGRLYRKKAQELHPDKGGDAQRFIRLTSAYEALLPSLQ